MSTFVSDVVKTISGGALNLTLFESELSKYRDSASYPEFQGNLVIKTDAISYLEDN